MHARFFTRIFTILLLSLAPLAHAQDEGGDKAGAGGDGPAYEAGFHLGYLLPNQIPGMTEITALGGVRGGLRFAPATYVEGGMIVGNGSGASWKNLHADVRIDIPVENLVGIAYLGADIIYYRGLHQSSRMIFGGHAGGGIQAQVTGDIWFRGDMKFGFSPGTSLYVGFGFEYRFGT